MVDRGYQRSDVTKTVSGSSAITFHVPADPCFQNRHHNDVVFYQDSILHSTNTSQQRLMAALRNILSSDAQEVVANIIYHKGAQEDELIGQQLRL